ncbi:MAG: spermidine synthase, partial [bacterium]|nr:spermidine synthase [bacterium]
MTRLLTPILCAVFFLSGAAALLFETLWFRQTGLTFGNSATASSLVLAAFMGGLALGNGLSARLGSRIQRPIRFYALLELIIAMVGVVLVWALPALTNGLSHFLRPFLNQPYLLNPLRLLLGFTLLSMPATAMGATLPLLVKALRAHDANFGAVLGRLYGWNTLGAVAGALAGEIALIEWFGIRGSAMVAALLDIIAALAALFIAARWNEIPETQQPAP